MRRLTTTNKFKKDLKKVEKKGKDLKKIQEIIRLLQGDRPLPDHCRDHALTGRWKPSRDCHIEPDWVLIYDASDPSELVLVRTGSHSDLFKK